MVRILIVLLSLIAVSEVSASTPDEKRAATDSLWRVLARTRNPNDSIATLYDLYDISERAMKSDVGMIIYDVAARTGNIDVQLDILRNNTNINVSSDSIMARYQSLAESLPESEDREETLTFIIINRLSYKYRGAGEDERQKIMTELIKRYERGGEEDLQGKIRRLYELCVCLGISAQGDLYVEYMEKLGELVAKLPHDTSHAIRNMYLTQLAIIESYNGRYLQSVNADKELLKEIELLKRIYKSKNRKFRNYDVNEYVCYTRLLGNFPALHPDEIERYYKAIQEISARNNDVARDLARNQRATIYYLMATRRYAEVLPILKEQVVIDRNRRYLRQYFKFMNEAAEAVGDQETQLYASKSYNRELETYLHNEAISRYKELQILYDVSELKSARAQLQIEKQASEHEWHYKMLIFSWIAFVVLIVLLVVLIFMYVRSRKLAVTLEQSKVRLQNEKKNLLEAQEELIQARDQAEQANRTQTQFIQNMRHEILTPLNAITGFSQLIADSAPENMRGEMDRYSEIIAANGELLRTLVNDVLDISQMENGEIKLSRQAVSLRQLCTLCVTNMSTKAKPGVVMTFDDKLDSDFVLYTDSARVEQVLNNFLSNAIKYTDKGTIRLSYEIDEDHNEVIFSVTDTGIGVPEGKEEMIFERFVKLSRYQNGTGLGLHICRFVAEMLGGRVSVDKSYNAGARFLFVLPID